MALHTISKALIFLVAGCIPLILCLDPLECALYENSGSVGAHINLFGSVPDLSCPSNSFDNRAKSYCVSGLWIFYSEPDYGYGLSQVDYSPLGTNQKCNDFSTVKDDVSSVRALAGADTLLDDSFRLYSYPCFMGEEMSATNDLPTISRAYNSASLIITGNSGWTIYQGDDYTGINVCLHAIPGVDNNPRSQTNIVNVGFPWGSIRSVRKGCNPIADQTVQVDPLSLYDNSTTLEVCKVGFKI